MSPRFLSIDVAQPAASFGGTYLHEDVHAMAAAYLFHIVQNHPFVDGNKRTGYITALAFLELNGVPAPFSDALYDLTMAVASGGLTKDLVTARLRALLPVP